MKNIYLDYAAATPMDNVCKAAMEPFFGPDFYNPSATYLAGRRTKAKLEDFRCSVAGELGAKPAEIVFTAGATEANNLAIHGMMRQFPGGEILTSAIEHESVLAPAEPYKHKTIKVDKYGYLDLKDLEAKISKDTVLVSIMLVNNEIGTIQPLKKISSILQKYRNQRRENNHKMPLLLHTDAAQAAAYLDLHTSRLGVDFMSLNGGKIYGPKQSGTLYIKAGIQLLPLIYGGGQEFGWRSGTENVAFAAGFSTALSQAQEMRLEESKKMTAFKEYFANELQKLNKNISVNGSAKYSAPHILSVTFAGTDNERLMMELDERGVICAVGSACSASSSEPSHVLAAIGLSRKEAQSTLRFSFGRQTTTEQLKRTIEVIKSLL